MRDYENPDLCIHGFLAGTLRNGRPRCPVCRRVVPIPPPKPPRPRHEQPVLDVALLRSGDDTPRPDAQVINLSTRRARKRTEI